MTESKLYKPELLPRKGEFTAWGLALLVTVMVYILNLRDSILTSTWFFIAFLYFSALSISLGNWMDRHTFIRLDENGVVFENGPRKVCLEWAEVKNVRTFPARWGTTVQVFGEKAHFKFNTLGEVYFRGKARGKMGFAQGQEILKIILRSAGLTVITPDGQMMNYSR